MAGDTENPRIWELADVYVADTDATAPTDTESALAADFAALGLLGEDGLTETRADEQKDHHAYGGILVRTTRSKHKRTLKVIALEDNPTVFDLANPGSDVDTAGGVTTRTVKVPRKNVKSFVVERQDGDIISRLYIPTGEVTTVGDVVTDDDNMSTKELTISIYPDADGVLYLEITDDPQAALGS